LSGARGLYMGGHLLTKQEKVVHRKERARGSVKKSLQASNPKGAFKQCFDAKRSTKLSMCFLEREEGKKATWGRESKAKPEWEGEG